MREIKFRAWDKNSKTMCDVNFIKFAKSQYLNIGYRIKNNGKIFDENSLLDENANGTCVLMQYIGLKDINGKEIYEGDIIIYNRNIAPSVDKNAYVVGWDDEQAKFNFLYDGGWSEIDAVDTVFGENIGNIYENPELLEVKK